MTSLAALAWRWARAGHEIVIGSRDPARAEAKAQELRARLPEARIIGAGLEEAAQAGTIVVLSVPYAAHRDTLERIKGVVDGKLIVDVTVPLVPPRVARVQLPPEGAVALVTQSVLGAGVKVVSAFQNVAAHLLEGEGGVERQGQGQSRSQSQSGEEEGKEVGFPNGRAGGDCGGRRPRLRADASAQRMFCVVDDAGTETPGEIS